MGSLLSSGQRRVGLLASGDPAPPSIYDMPQVQQLTAPNYDAVMQQPVDAATAYWDWRRRNGEQMAAAYRGMQPGATPEQRQMARDWMGNVAAGFVGGLKVKVPDEIWPSLPAEPAYGYHATRVGAAEDIAQSKMMTFRPSHGTPDQNMWPDGAVEKRAYFATSPNSARSFIPEGWGDPVLLRADRKTMKSERGTGDLYTTKPVAPKDLEILTPNGWEPILEAMKKYGWAPFMAGTAAGGGLLSSEGQQ